MLLIVVGILCVVQTRFLNFSMCKIFFYNQPINHMKSTLTYLIVVLNKITRILRLIITLLKIKVKNNQ